MNWIYEIIAKLVVRLDPKVYSILFVFLVAGNAVLEALIRYDVLSGGAWQTVIMVISGLLALLSAPDTTPKANNTTTQAKRDKASAAAGE